MLRRDDRVTGVDISEKMVGEAKEQVLANGSLGVLLVILSSQNPSDFWIWVAYGGSIAAVRPMWSIAALAML